METKHNHVKYIGKQNFSRKELIEKSKEIFDLLNKRRSLRFFGKNISH